jgi:hypothetical protein
MCCTTQSDFHCRLWDEVCAFAAAVPLMTHATIASQRTSRDRTPALFLAGPDAHGA